MSLMHNGVASTFSIAYRESFRERESGRVRKGAGAINAFTFGIGCISNAAAAFSSLSLTLPLSRSAALWWLCRCCCVFTYIAYLLKCSQERERERTKLVRGARGRRGAVRIKGALRKELKCNNSCCGHAQSVLYAAFVYLLTYPPPSLYLSLISFAFGMVRIC